MTHLEYFSLFPVSINEALPNYTGSAEIYTATVADRKT